MTLEQKVDEYVALNNGHFIDEDHAYGSQCWDVPARFARVYLGCPYFPTGSGGAEGLYRLFLDPLPQFFDKVPGSDLKKGDTAVWDASFYPPYGHTALVWAREGNTIWVFEQDGSNDPDGDGNANGVAYLTQRSITNKVNGLRPKGQDMGFTQDGAEKFVSQAYRAATDIDPTPEQAGYWVERVKADPNTAYELLAALGGNSYMGDPLFRQKGRNYDKDIAAASGGVVPAPQLFIKPQAK